MIPVTWFRDHTPEGVSKIQKEEREVQDDPLVAIIGQLWMELQNGSFKEVCAAVKQASQPLIGKIGLNFLKKLVEMIPGIDLTGVEKKDLETASEAAYDDYLDLTNARNDLRRRLQELADKVYGEDSFPLIYPCWNESSIFSISSTSFLCWE